MDFAYLVINKGHILNLFQGSLYLNIDKEYILKGLIILPIEENYASLIFNI